MYKCETVAKYHNDMEIQVKKLHYELALILVKDIIYISMSV